LLDTEYAQRDTFYNVIDLLPGVMGGLGGGRYAEIIDDVLDLLDRTSARLPPTRLLDFVDLLVASACPNPGARQSFLTYTEQHRQDHERYWTRSDWQFLYDLAEEIGVSGLVPPVPPPEDSNAPADPLSLLGGRYVGIYTLTESAGDRTAKLLEQRASNVKVEISNAKASTKRLKAIAQNADVMLMVTSSATHAATNAIEANLGAATKLVRPQGSGSSSMLSALEKVARQFDSQML
jgi:hypothetical protein